MAFHCIIEFFQERLCDRVYQHYSLMAAFAAKRHRPWVDDVWIQLLMAVFSQITSPSILFFHLKLVNRAKPRIFTTLCPVGQADLGKRQKIGRLHSDSYVVLAYLMENAKKNQLLRPFLVVTRSLKMGGF